MLNGGKHKSTYFQSKAGASIKYVYSVCDIRRVAYSTNGLYLCISTYSVHILQTVASFVNMSMLNSRFFYFRFQKLV